MLDEERVDPPNEEAEVQSKGMEVKSSVPFSQLFRFAEGKDRFAIFLAIVCASIHGCTIPLFPVVFGIIVDSFDPTE